MTLGLQQESVCARFGARFAEASAETKFGLATRGDEKHLLVSFTGLPGFDRLRTDPRFGALQVRMGLRPAQPTEAVP